MFTVLLSLSLSTAHAQHIVPEVDVSELPGLLEGLRTGKPVMGQCPLGDEADGEAVALDRHLLHLGTTGFYLDYKERLRLDADQVSELEAIQARSLAKGSLLDQQIEAQEATLWALTGQSNRDMAAITAAIREIEALQAERRLHYITAVAEAAAILRADQIAALMD